MNLRAVFASGLLLLGSVALSGASSKPISDLVSPEKRRAIVDLGLRLARAPEPAPLPPDLPHPFSPPNFEQPDPEEIRAAAAAAGRANTAVAGATPGAGTQAPRLPADREILENIAPKILPTGTIKVGGEPLLIFGRKNVKIGSRFTVTDPTSAQEYELELIAIDTTTFTLRFRNEEITRPIKSGKSQ